MNHEPFPQPMRGRDLLDLGLRPPDIAELVKEGVLVQPFRGVFVAATQIDVPEVRAAALGLVLPPGAAVAREMAAWLWGIDARPPGRHAQPPILECVVDAGTSTPPRLDGVRAYAASLPDGDVVQHLGVPVTSAERTVLDLARYLPEYMGLAVADAFTHAKLADLERLRVRIEEWRGGRWVDRARRVLSLCEPLTESFGESWVRLRVVDAGFPRPTPQIWIYDWAGTGVYRLDMGWEEHKVALEYDGEEHHSNEDDVAHDAARREDLARRFGWSTYGVGKGLVLGPSLQLELAIGELLSMEPLIRRRRW